MMIGGNLIAVNEMLARCLASSFYSTRIPSSSLRSLTELKKLPLTKKDDLRQHSPYGFLAVPQNQVAVYHESFGTTGKPVSIWLTEQDLLDTASEIEACGVNLTPDDRVLIRYPYAISQVAHTFHLAARRQGACVIPVSSRSAISPFPRVVNMLRYLEVTVLAALPLQAILLAATAELMGLSPGRDFPHLRAICTAGEPLTPGRRKFIEQLWHVPIFDNYGMTELGAVALDCAHGRLHPRLDDFVVELLDPDGETSVQLGDIGYLVVSTLRRRATPLLRYWTGDRVRLLRESCPCGAQYRLEVRGRQEDCLEAAGQIFDLWDLEAMIDGILGKGLWAVGLLENGGLHFVAENWSLEHKDPQATVLDLEEQYQVPIKIDMVPKGVFYEPKALLTTGNIGKPRYVYTTKELITRAYENSLSL
ncbi:MAG: phenylacetate--CoA ligase family protein [Firmicutes bacterium]|nr:phenylacetate--CoA ligase family protein [Bacillota bacterium]